MAKGHSIGVERKIGRRGLLGMAASGLLSGDLGLGSALASPLGLSGGEPDEAVVERWMSQWMGSGPRMSIGGLFLGRFKDPIYFLTKPIAWKPNPHETTRFPEVNVPVGFVTDLASVPRVFWSLLCPDGDYTFPAIIHDYLYWMQTTTRADADGIFKAAMADFDIGAVTANTIYDAVRLGGGSAWSGNAAMRATGEKRILARFPDDPRETWDHWKKMAGVFV